MASEHSRKCLWKLAALPAILLFAALLGCASSDTYVVRPGDTLRQIALAHDIALSDLIEANRTRYPNLESDPDSLDPGMELLIPTQDRRGLNLDAWLARIAGAASPPITPMPAVPATPDAKTAAIIRGILHRVNRERAAHRLRPLIFDERLYRIAQQRSDDMIRRQYFSHIDPLSGRAALQELLRQKRWRFLFVGENIAEIRNQNLRISRNLTVYTYHDPDELASKFVADWLESVEHRENILNSHYAKTGIAVGVSVDGTRIVATQIFSD